MSSYNNFTGLHLVKPDKKHSELWYLAVSEFKMSDDLIVPFALHLNIDDYDKYLLQTRNNENEGKIPSGKLPSSTYFLMDLSEDKILGTVNIRHRLNETFLHHIGHIGYGVTPSERRKGLGCEQLRLALAICKDMGIDKVLLCCDKTNTASAKTILKNGGVLENEVDNDEEVRQRYWVRL